MLACIRAMACASSSPEWWSSSCWCVSTCLLWHAIFPYSKGSRGEGRKKEEEEDVEGEGGEEGEEEAEEEEPEEEEEQEEEEEVTWYIFIN